MTNIGWVGVGAMGRPMAATFAASGVKIRAFDSNRHQLEGIEELNIEAASSADRVAKDADILVIMVATPAQGEEVLFGEHGGAAHLRSGTVVVVMSTVGPDAVIRWSTALASLGVELVDAPVSGGVARAASGELLTMVGGSSAALARVQGILDVLSRSVVVAGPLPGDGQRMKLVNQLLCGVHIAVAAEALGFAEALGLDVKAAWEVVRQGAASSFMLEDRGERMTDGAFEDVKSAVNIFVKDMNLVGVAAHDATYPTPIASAAEQLYLMASRAGLGSLDDSVVIEVARGALDRWTRPFDADETTKLEGESTRAHGEHS